MPAMPMQHGKRMDVCILTWVLSSCILYLASAQALSRDVVAVRKAVCPWGTDCYRAVNRTTELARREHAAGFFAAPCLDDARYFEVLQEPSPPFAVDEIEHAVIAEIRRRVLYENLVLPVAFLPVTWHTTLNVPHGNRSVREAAVKHLQPCLDTIPRDLPCFLVLRHFRGAAEYASDLRFPPHCIIFHASGTGHVPIPLTYTDSGKLQSFAALHAGATREAVPSIWPLGPEGPGIPVSKGWNERKWLASYAGSKTTHVRTLLERAFANETDVFFLQRGYWTPTVQAEAQRAFLLSGADSRFMLAPSGSGPTSFRLLEAMRLGAVPVYIYEEQPFLPLTDRVRWRDLALFVDVSQIFQLPQILRAVTQEQWEAMRNAWLEVSELFNVPAVVDFILQTVRDRSPARRYLV